MQPYREEEYEAQTQNGSAVRLVRKFYSALSAWGTGHYEDIAFIDILNEKDLQAIEETGFPRWYYDFTGKGLVLPFHKQEYVAQQLRSLLGITIKHIS